MPRLLFLRLCLKLKVPQSCPTLLKAWTVYSLLGLCQMHSPGKNLGEGKHIPPPAGPPYPGIESRSPTLQAFFTI